MILIWGGLKVVFQVVFVQKNKEKIYKKKKKKTCYTDQNLKDKC